MSWRKSVLSTVLVCVAAGSATMSIAAECCTWQYFWPGGGPGGSNGTACSGSSTVVCDAIPRNSVATDPPQFIQKWTGVLTQATCVEYTLISGASFVQAQCHQMQTGWILLGRLPSGDCCFIKPAQGVSIEYDTFPRGFEIYKCEGFCELEPVES